ncbi:MAG: Ku protein, partial [Roseicyclus sp.]
FEDRYSEALRGLIEKKRKAKKGEAVIEDVDEPGGGRGGNVVDLMAALKKSVGEEKGSDAAPKKRSRSGKSA